MRVAFATNDERTAKRISDALGTATEQRAMRNYAGHRLAPWLAHVMVSRQETARQLLTPGEVMQLSPDEELVLVSGLAPIRARKLRYFRDRNFAARVAPAPVLASGQYADRPKPRGDDWSDQVRGIDARLHQAEDAAGGEDDGGMQQQRHPGLPEQVSKATDPADTRDPQIVPDDDDVAADKRAMDQAQGQNAIVRGHAINEGAKRDLIPDF
ncbi:type IV secretory system conjugative DNA transfer family protein [Sphingobium xenophagum]